MCHYMTHPVGLTLCFLSLASHQHLKTHFCALFAAGCCIPEMKFYSRPHTHLYLPVRYSEKERVFSTYSPTRKGLKIGLHFFLEILSDEKNNVCNSGVECTSH